MNYKILAVLIVLCCTAKQNNTLVKTEPIITEKDKENKATVRYNMINYRRMLIDMINKEKLYCPWCGDVDSYKQLYEIIEDNELCYCTKQCRKCGNIYIIAIKDSKLHISKQ